eukprot:9339797-Pyramimonas_sp.AAC.1
MIANAARSTGQHRSAATAEKATEGGEIIFAKKHLQVTSLNGLQAKALKAPGSAAVDGFVGSVVHCEGFSFIVCVFYGFCSSGMSGRNLARF